MAPGRRARLAEQAARGQRGRRGTARAGPLLRRGRLVAVVRLRGVAAGLVLHGVVVVDVVGGAVEHVADDVPLGLLVHVGGRDAVVEAGGGVALDAQLGVLDAAELDGGRLDVAPA